MTADTVPEVRPDRGRWDGEVVSSGTVPLSWGIHRWEVEYRVFADGGGHITVGGAPTTPPAAAEEIVADLLVGDGLAPHVAVVLAHNWGLDVDAARGEP